jgi:TolB protein
MDADGSNERRLTFGGGRYAAPDWSPDGEWIAFTRLGSDGRRIGIVKSDGRGEKILTTGPSDEGASWAASSRELVFQRTDPTGRDRLYRVSIDGEDPRRIEVPQDGTDPDWSGAMD